MLNVTVYSQSKGSFIPIIEDNDTIQNKYQWMGTEGRMLSEMKLNYHKPKMFNEVGNTECFNDYPKLESTFTCMGKQLHSKDGQFISFLVFPSIYTEEFQKRLNWVSSNHSEVWVDKQHYRQMRGIIKKYYGEVGDSWTDSIKHYIKEDAVKKFNADSAFYFSLKLQPSDFYKKEFRHVKVLFLQKKGRGYAYICSFYTDKAKAKLEKYWTRIEKVLRYED